MIPRARYQTLIEKTLRNNPICALLGPRQCGKTTLAREFGGSKKQAHFFDLETAAGRARLANPEMTLSSLQGLVVVDEIQRQPDLFTVLRPLADRQNSRTRFLVLGSASPELVRGVSESLAGRVGFVDLAGFDLEEVSSSHWRKLWLRGGFPRSYLARGESVSLAWRNDFIRTVLERDLPQLGIRIASETLHRFWTMLAHYHGQIWSGAELARSLAVSEHTVRHYLDILTGAYLLRQLSPWFENIAKRQYRSPKVYVRDSGLLHALLSIGQQTELESHPKYGASWEGFALEQVLCVIGARDTYYWGTHAGAELDLFFFRGGKRFGIEFKCNDAPTMTKSLHVAIASLGLERAWIIYPGSERYRIHDKVEVLPLTAAPEIVAELGR
jgi:predicted AAA+ superfamily ATPase